MRITGGGARGIPLDVPHGDRVRPATDALRQAVFSSLGARVGGARFLDLFAGSGAYGLEAWSRGAQTGCFVEHDARTAACLERNLAAVARSLGQTEEALTVLEADVLAALRGARLPERVDLVFVDPPYEDIPALEGPLFSTLAERLSPADDPIVVLELPGELQLAPPGWLPVKRLGKPRGRQPTAAFFRLAAAE